MSCCSVASEEKTSYCWRKVGGSKEREGVDICDDREKEEEQEQEGEVRRQAGETGGEGYVPSENDEGKKI